VSFKNIYIRFENELSREEEPYAIGLKLKEFGIYSTDHKFDVLSDKTPKKDEIFEEESTRPKWAKDDD
jgi:hypothetical protein